MSLVGRKRTSATAKSKAGRVPGSVSASKPADADKPLAICAAHVKKLESAVNAVYTEEEMKEWEAQRMQDEDGVSIDSSLESGGAVITAMTAITPVGESRRVSTLGNLVANAGEDVQEKLSKLHTNRRVAALAELHRWFASRERSAQQEADSAAEQEKIAIDQGAEYNKWKNQLSEALEREGAEALDRNHKALERLRDRQRQRLERETKHRRKQGVQFADGDTREGAIQLLHSAEEHDHPVDCSEALRSAHKTNRELRGHLQQLDDREAAAAGSEHQVRLEEVKQLITAKRRGVDQLAFKLEREKRAKEDLDQAVQAVKEGAFNAAYVVAYHAAKDEPKWGEDQQDAVGLLLRETATHLLEQRVDALKRANPRLSEYQARQKAADLDAVEMKTKQKALYKELEDLQTKIAELPKTALSTAVETGEVEQLQDEHTAKLREHDYLQSRLATLTTTCTNFEDTCQALEDAKLSLGHVLKAEAERIIRAEEAGKVQEHLEQLMNKAQDAVPVAANASDPTESSPRHKRVHFVAKGRSAKAADLKTSGGKSKSSNNSGSLSPRKGCAGPGQAPVPALDSSIMVRAMSGDADADASQTTSSTDGRRWLTQSWKEADFHPAVLARLLWPDAKRAIQERTAYETGLGWTMTQDDTCDFPKWIRLLREQVEGLEVDMFPDVKKESQEGSSAEPARLTLDFKVSKQGHDYEDKKEEFAVLQRLLLQAQETSAQCQRVSGRICDYDQEVVAAPAKLGSKDAPVPRHRKPSVVLAALSALRSSMRTTRRENRVRTEAPRTAKVEAMWEPEPPSRANPKPGYRLARRYATTAPLSSNIVEEP